LEEWDGFSTPGEGGVKNESHAEEAPLTPVGPVSGGAAGRDAGGSNLVLAKVVESPCCGADVKWSIIQDVACGNARSKKEQSCGSDRSQ
jgi:hypothetical protein